MRLIKHNPQATQYVLDSPICASQDWHATGQKQNNHGLREELLRCVEDHPTSHIMDMLVQHPACSTGLVITIPIPGRKTVPVYYFLSSRATPSFFVPAIAQIRENLACRHLCSLFQFVFPQSAYGMGDCDKGVTTDARNRGLDFGSWNEQIGDYYRRGDVPLLEFDTVVQTARATGTSVTYAGNNKMTLLRQFID